MFANRRFKKAMEEWSLEGMREALASGAKVDKIIKSSHMKSKARPLVIAMVNERYDVAKFLIENGADVNKVHNAELMIGIEVPLFYPLELACKQNAPLEFVQLLVERGARVNATSGFGYKAIHFAAKYSNETTKFLIAAGAKVNTAEGRSGDTPLHLAAKVNKPDIVKTLLDAGADITIKNSVGHTPIKAARKSGNKKVVELLARVETGRLIAEARVETGWEVVSPQEIALRTKKEKIGYLITEIFNFAADERSYTVITKNLIDGAESNSVRQFSELEDKTKLKKAFNKLIEKGGKAERQVIFGKVIDKGPTQKPHGHIPK